MADQGLKPAARRLRPSGELDDLRRGFLLSKLPFALRQRRELGADIGLGGCHGHHARFVFRLEGVYGSGAELGIDIFRCQPFDQAGVGRLVSGGSAPAGCLNFCRSSGNSEWRSMPMALPAVDGRPRCRSRIASVAMWS